MEQKEIPSGQVQSAIFEPKHFRWLVFTSFIFVLSLIVFLIGFPGYLDFEIVRFLVLILVSLYLSLMFFILWPHNANIENIPLINLPVKMAGPVVLWLVIFMITNRLMPDDNMQEKIFIINKADENFRVPYHDTKLKSDETVLDYMMIEDADAKSHLRAVYVKFPKGKSDLKARLEFTKYKPIDLTLTRNTNSIFIPKLDKYE